MGQQSGLGKRAGRIARVLISGCGVILAGAQAVGQSSGPGQQPGSTGGSSSGSGQLSVSTVNQAQQQLTNVGQPGVQVTSDSYKGSIVSGTATAGVMDLSLDEAMQRGLRTNLGIILQSSSE
jgi:hypothetical protein